MNLTHLSFQRPPRLHKQMPAAPTNAERLREFRIAKASRAQVGNEYVWNFGSRLTVRAAK